VQRSRGAANKRLARGSRFSKKLDLALSAKLNLAHLKKLNLELSKKLNLPLFNKLNLATDYRERVLD
jgi:hypothetical protein